MYKVVESIFIRYMHRKPNMTKFFKFVYTMFILISLFLVVTNANANNCTDTSDCSSNHCSYEGVSLCMNGQCICIYE
ncbi:putative Late nodulin [Medicago truncatula]|uniref:Late nodulin n=2 Tax=Medicago truncatula TaxID=3880 RepID=G7JZU5_MEDTR|nr:late nodulin [Medicago truncatula]RHN53844.1 putative Late nodulin [Medicago truncatula]